MQLGMRSRSLRWALLLPLGAVWFSARPAIAADEVACSDALKAEVLANLWTRPPAAKPTRRAAKVRVRFRNAYGRSARALLLALDGTPTRLSCDAGEVEGEVFDGLLEPGVHYLDAVFNFGPGRVGRSPHRFVVKAGRDLSLTVVIDRNDEEAPIAYVEPRPRR